MDALAPRRGSGRCAICADRLRGLSVGRKPDIIQTVGGASHCPSGNGALVDGAPMDTREVVVETQDVYRFAIRQTVRG